MASVARLRPPPGDPPLFQRQATLLRAPAIYAAGAVTGPQPPLILALTTAVPLTLATALSLTLSSAFFLTLSTALDCVR